MGVQSAIEWTDATWNPWQGCRRVSDGCAHCYMYAGVKRWGGDPAAVRRSARRTFELPTRLAPGTRVFVCSWSDFWIEDADEWRPEAFELIRRRPDLRFIIPTKRPENIASRLPDDWGSGWRQVLLMVSTEHQEAYGRRWPLLRDVPAAARGISAEPLLGALRLHADLMPTYLPRPDWVICGGESGPQARPMHVAWARLLRDECLRYGIPFFFKQWGEWGRCTGYRLAWGRCTDYRLASAALQEDHPCNACTRECHGFGDGEMAVRLGKKAAGRCLDGLEWAMMPGWAE